MPEIVASSRDPPRLMANLDPHPRAYVPLRAGIEIQRDPKRHLTVLTLRLRDSN